MDYEAYTRDGINFIEVGGEINAENCARLKEEITASITQSPHFILNFKNLTYIDSTGIGTLMAMSALVNKAGGRIRLVGVPRNVRRILDLVNATEMFDLYEECEAALKDQPPA